MGDRSDSDGTADSMPSPAPDSPSRRPYVCIYFECCGVYTRVYRRPEENSYHARCPRCLRPVTLRVGPDGTSARFFTAR
jgi:hypothetical protein